MQFVLKTFMGGGSTQSQGNNTSTPGANAPIPAFSARPSLAELEGQYNPIPQTLAPIWSTDSVVDISMYLSPSLIMPSLKTIPSQTLVLQETGLHLNNSHENRVIRTSFDVPKEVQHNATLWAHFYVSQTGAAQDPTDGHYDPATAYHFVRPLNQFLLKKKEAKKRNLLSGSGEDDDVDAQFEDTGRTIGSYFHPNFTISFVPNTGVVSYTSMHPAAREWIQLESTGAREVSGQNGWYYPLLYINTFWQLQQHMTELNETVTHLPLNIDLNMMAYWKFNIMSSMDFGMKQNKAKMAAGEKLPGGGDGSELEEIKRILIDSNIYLLSTTVIVGFFHMIFEMLAFKSDVSHWRNKKDNVGVSVRTILANVFMQTIILLYLIDNTQTTSWVIFFSQAMGIVLEAWKITKTVDVRIRETPADSTSFPWRYLPYTIVFEDKHKLSETEQKTQEYDEIAFQYLYWVAIPLLGAYAVYSLMYESHKSWYSFIITTLVGSVYAYGFLMMVPSLYINYRLQSVAHMPAKAMTYKFLNTFIDDLFAFTVKMPALHRLATLRDDVIFFVYLYQSYKYKVDYTRVNEFGQGGDDEGVPEKEAAQPLKAPASGKADDGNVVAEATASGRDAGGATKRK
ncbi:MAG: hypothetical protein M1828_002181 [Chrysothrix sp. TS-e1954]|nr:MAG: hypothetical protein M1828_002181 [Chrysothrix sp. TS-e1954]